jgi:transcriptional regulator with XRE-family HTH domain
LSIGKRIKEIRKKLGIKQIDMANNLKMKQGSLSDIERGKVNNVKDYIITGICSHYLINDKWLRTGEGEMIEPSHSFEDFMQSRVKLLDETDKKIIEEYIKLNSNQRRAIKDFIRKLL